ncbi:MAG: chorismate-binding protein [Myxococcales bacterium]|nr:chorismate-binding protein [Myxococcales bacterium]
MRFEPDFEEFCRLAQDAVLVPVSTRIVADTLTPVGAFATVGRGDGSYLLESVVGGEQIGRYSFVGFDPECLVAGAQGRFECLRGGRTTYTDTEQPWESLRHLLKTHHANKQPWLPHFWGGAVGYVAYDAVRAFEPSVGQGSHGTTDEYDFLFAIGGTVIIFDNLMQTLRVVRAVRIRDGADLRTLYEDAVAHLTRVHGQLREPVRLPELSLEIVEHMGAELPPSSFDKQSYQAAVEKAREYIRSGDIYQVVLSQCFRQPSDGIDPFDVYRAMRVINPSPYNYFLRFPQTRIAGASPETMVKLTDGVVEVRPIAGTRHRSEDGAEDQRIEDELLADPKERSEHVMLVDLGRNDVGRISRTGTVKVTDRMIVERYSHVMHIVSNVTGELVENCDAVDVLRATFPAGTLSGAPKIRAMQIIDELEPERRGVYGGAVGYISFEGAMDLAIAIRTVIEAKGEYRIQAGAGIVEASDSAKEYEETLNKARASLLALRMASHPRNAAF